MTHPGDRQQRERVDGALPAAGPKPVQRPRRIGWALAIAPLLVTFALYARGLHGAFVIDDRTFFVENDVLPKLGLADAWRVFVGPTNDWGDFQPIRDLLFVLEHHLFGAETAGYHVVSTVLYALACALVFVLVREVHAGSEGQAAADGSRSAVAALAAAALFAVHPVHVEAVAYVCGQKELLFAVFSLAALIAFRRAFDGRERRAATLAAAVAAYYLALLSKQSAIVLVVLVPLLYLLSDAARRPPWLASCVVWVIVNVPAALWMIVSRAAFQALWHRNSELNATPLLQRIPLALEVLGAHARLAVKPFPLSFGYPFGSSAGLDGNLVAGALTLLALIAVAVRFRKDALVVLGAATFLLPLVPVLQLHGSLNNASVYDRYLFLPVLGLAILFERLASALFMRRVGSRPLYAATVGAAVVAGSVLTVSYVPAFASDVAVTRNSHQRFPAWRRAAFEHAGALIEAGQLDEAASLVQREESFSSPPWVRGYLAGWILLERGDLDAAIPTLSSASLIARVGGYFPFPSVPLGRALVRAGRLAEAERELRYPLVAAVYQPLEIYRARKLLESVVRMRAAAPEASASHE